MLPGTSSSVSADSPPPVVVPKIVDLFAGPGGLDVAAHWLDVPATGIEWDPNALATRRRAGLDTVSGDVRRSHAHEFRDANVLCAGPPCQTFTVAGAGSGRRALAEVRDLALRLAVERDLPEATFDDLQDERTGLVLEPLRWILAAKDAGHPYEAVVLEQVQAVRPLWETLAALLRLEGYAVETGVLMAEQFGVPQTRRRAILVARWGLAGIGLPAATHQAYRRGVEPDLHHPELEPWKSMGEVLRRRNFSVRSNYGTGGDPRARGHRTWAQPSATITGKIGRNRVDTGGEITRFSHRDAGILQTFPRDFPWRGKDIDQQIGNAIPPRLAAHVLNYVLGLQTPPGAYDGFVTRSWDKNGECATAPGSGAAVVDLDRATTGPDARDQPGLLAGVESDRQALSG